MFCFCYLCLLQILFSSLHVLLGDKSGCDVSSVRGHLNLTTGLNVTLQQRLWTYKVVSRSQVTSDLLEKQQGLKCARGVVLDTR